MIDSVAEYRAFGYESQALIDIQRSGPEPFAALHNIYEYTRCQPMRFGRVILERLSGSVVDITEHACLNPTEERTYYSPSRVSLMTRSGQLA